MQTLLSVFTKGFLISIYEDEDTAMTTPLLLLCTEYCILSCVGRIVVYSQCTVFRDSVWYLTLCIVLFDVNGT